MSDDGGGVSGGEAIVGALADVGVGALFAVHGVQIDPIFQACADLGVGLTDTRHEATAGFAAEGYARVTGGLGAAAVCPGPGFTNVFTSIVNAHTDRTAVLYVVGSPPAGATVESNGLQAGLDHAAIAVPVTKWACRVTAREHLARVVAQAIRVATTAPRGPVVLDVGADVLEAVSAPGPVVTLPTPADSDRRAVRAGLEALAGARRPAVLVGDPPRRAGRDALTHLLDVTGVPCFTGYEAIGLLDDDDRRYGGTLFQLARLPEAARPDAAVLFGVRLGFETPGLRDGGLAWGTRLVHVDGDAAEIGRFAPAEVAMVADPDAAAVAFAEEADSLAWSTDAGWLRTVREELARTRAELDGLDRSDGGRLHPYHAAAAVSAAAARTGAVVVGDGAICKHWLHDALRLPAGSRYLTHGRFGCMGTGLGTAVGAARARPDRPVVVVTGDGAFGFSAGDLEAVARHRLPITVVVMNNARWGASMGFQLRPDGPGRVVGTELSDADYHEVMVAFGGQGQRVSTIAALDTALEQALAGGEPTCINVAVHAHGRAAEIALLR